MKAFIIAALAGALLSTGCQSDRRDVGTGIGAVVGGVIGNQFGRGSGNAAATILGAAVGGYVGSQMGASMDRNDQGRLGRALENNRSGEVSNWKNPDSGYRYSVTPKLAHHENGRVCREFRQVGHFDGRRDSLKGLACRGSDGHWRIVRVY